MTKVLAELDTIGSKGKARTFQQLLKIAPNGDKRRLLPLLQQLQRDGMVHFTPDDGQVSDDTLVSLVTNPG